MNKKFIISLVFTILIMLSIFIYFQIQTFKVRCPDCAIPLKAGDYTVIFTKPDYFLEFEVDFPQFTFDDTKTTRSNIGVTVDQKHIYVLAEILSKDYVYLVQPYHKHDLFEEVK